APSELRPDELNPSEACARYQATAATPDPNPRARRGVGVLPLIRSGDVYEAPNAAGQHDDAARDECDIGGSSEARGLRLEALCVERRRLRSGGLVVARTRDRSEDRAGADAGDAETHNHPRDGRGSVLLHRLWPTAVLLGRIPLAYGTLQGRDPAVDGA